MLRRLGSWKPLGPALGESVGLPIHPTSKTDLPWGGCTDCWGSVPENGLSFCEILRLCGSEWAADISRQAQLNVT